MRVFADTNIIVYAESDDGEKSVRGRSIVESGPVISTQIVNETIAALTSKFRFSRPDAYEVANALMDLCEVVPVDQRTVREAMTLARSEFDRRQQVAPGRDAPDAVAPSVFQNAVVRSEAAVH